VNTLFRRAARAIDTGWHHSWHWKRNDYGGFTAAGIHQSIDDGVRELSAARRRVEDIESVLAELRASAPDYEGMAGDL